MPGVHSKDMERNTKDDSKNAIDHLSKILFIEAIVRKQKRRLRLQNKTSGDLS